MDKLPGARFHEPVRPDGAQNKTLISNTGTYMIIFSLGFTFSLASVPGGGDRH